MDENTDNKQDLKYKSLNFFKNNKKKFYILLLFFFILTISLIYLKNRIEKQNILISEKFVQAGIFLASNEKEKAKNMYEEIILSGSKFYSILSLNTILEKNLVLDKKKILNYFRIIEKTVSNKESKELINLKKALYLIKESDKKNGDNLLQSLIEKNSNLKSIAKEILED